MADTERRLKFLYQRRLVYFNRIKNLNCNFLKKFGECDEVLINRYIQKRDLLFDSALRTTESIEKIQRGSSTSGPGFKQWQDQAKDRMKEIVDQDLVIIGNIDEYKKSLGEGLRRLNEIEKYLKSQEA